MRADIEQLVWQAKCAANIRSWKFVLLNLCSHANLEGNAFPGVTTIVRETGYSGKAVIDALTGLEALGIIKKSGKCGERKRVDIYNILGVFQHVDKLAGNVDKSSNSEVSSCLQLDPPPANSELSSFNGELSSGFNGELSSGRINLYKHNKKLVSKLVSMPPNSEVSSPLVDNSRETTPGGAKETSGRPSPHGATRRMEAGRNNIAQAAAKFDWKEHPYLEWRRLLMTDGFKPTTREGRVAAECFCWEMGASIIEAGRFGDYNASRKWGAISAQLNVRDLIRGWIRKWKKTDPDGYFDEQQARRQKCQQMSTI